MKVRKNFSKEVARDEKFEKKKKINSIQKMLKDEKRKLGKVSKLSIAMVQMTNDGHGLNSDRFMGCTESKIEVS